MVSYNMEEEGGKHVDGELGCLVPQYSSFPAQIALMPSFPRIGEGH